MLLKKTEAAIGVPACKSTEDVSRGGHVRAVQSRGQQLIVGNWHFLASSLPHVIVFACTVIDFH